MNNSAIDRVIQEVFNQYKNRVLIDNKTLESLKQQLIGKVKQEQKAILAQIRVEIEKLPDITPRRDYGMVPEALEKFSVLEIIDKHLNQSKERGSK